MGVYPLFMALITLGSVATDIRNSIGGVTYSRNKGGAYARARVVPLNPQTTAQTTVRANFANNSKAWSGTLTAAQRTAWTNFAAVNPYVNVLGASIILSGIAMFQSLNQILSQIGSAQETDPPPDLSVPAIAASSSVEADSTGPTFVVNTAAQAVSATTSYYVMATGTLSPGKTPQSSDFRYLGLYAPVAAAVTVSLLAQWVANNGALVSGTVIGVRVAQVNLATGAILPAISYMTTVI